MAKLEIRSVSKSYGAVRAVDGISLDVAEGETIVLLGPSGCGKTTLLRMIAGFIKPEAGTISIAGKVVAADGVMVPPERRSLSMVFQSYAVWPHKTVFENLAYGLRLRKLDRATIDAKVAAALGMVRLDGLAQRYPAELSGGQQQRVALARALVLEPEILLFDEPLSNLDAALREHMRFEIKALLGKLGITAIYVTHDQHEAMVVADRIAVMNRGRIEQLGTAEALYHRSATAFVARFIGLANVLPAVMIEAGVGGRVVVEAAGLGRIAARSEVAGLGVGDKVVVYLRPEQVRLGDAAAGENALRGTVSRHTFLGATADLLVDVGGVPVRVILPSREAGARAGDAVTLGFSADDCFVLRAGEGENA